MIDSRSDNAGSHRQQSPDSQNRNQSGIDYMNQDDLSQSEPSLWRQTVLPSLSLFTSVGTLVCCALPALLVTIGLGASLAGLISAAPWITVISEWKITVFIVSGVLLAGTATMQWKARNMPCPIDPDKARACARMRIISWWILGIAVSLYLVGFFFAFLAIHVLY